MRRLTLAALVLLASIRPVEAAGAQNRPSTPSRTDRGATARPAPGTAVIRDTYGRRTGAAETRRDGSVVVRDQFGRTTHRLDAPSRSGQQVIRDQWGRRVGTVSPR